MLEYRNSERIFELSSDTEDRHITGYALTFDNESVDLGGFVEKIDRHALDGVIEKSDVICLLDHNRDRGVLARSTNGTGSLTLTVDDIGLKYEFDAPRTALGDEVLEALRRGDISKSSFGFTVAEDNWVKRDDGSILRIINQIDTLFDVSIVWFPAYEQTSVKVDKRGLLSLLKKDNELSDKVMTEDKIETRSTEEDEKPVAEDTQGSGSGDAPEDNPDNSGDNTEEERNTGTDNGECKEDREDTGSDEAVEEKKPETEEEKETVEDDTEENNTENNTENNRSITNMKNFSLIDSINAVIENRQFDDATATMIAEARSAMNNAGLNSNGQIVIPVEYRAEGDVPAAPEVDPTNGVFASVKGKGSETVATDKWDILPALRAKSVLAEAGATWLTGLRSNISIPAYSGSNCAWKGEVASADNGVGTWSEVNYSPKRLTAYIDISKQILLNGAAGLEDFLRRDIVAALAEKLEKTLLGDGVATDNIPAGLFNGVTAMTAAIKYADIVDLEAELENANVYGSLSYIVSPKTKATLRTTPKDAGSSGRFVMEDGEIEGITAYCSSAVKDKGLILGNFADYVVCQWGAIDVTVDQYSKAAEGCIRLVINAFFDAKPRRAESFVKKILK